MLVVDRESFIAWTKGILLQRDGSGCVVGDKIEHEEVEGLLEKGEKVYLSFNHRIISYLEKTADGFQEYLFEEKPN